MRVVSAPDHVLHQPRFELIGGKLTPTAELPARMEWIAGELARRGRGEALPPQDFGMAPLAAVHGAGYLAFLQHAHADLQAAGFDETTFGSAWPVPDMRADREPRNLLARLGYYSSDGCSPITAGTWAAAYGSAQAALTALQYVQRGDNGSIALCRPPGHHAAAHRAGGYCYLNNAAIAAQHALDQGAGRVAVLDVDYHHGNGTQSIFYDRPDVFCLSLHADPLDAYPYFLGHADEQGEGAGAGYNRNYPLPLGCDFATWRRALDDALRLLAAYAPDLMVVSLGVDTYKDDPISHFRLDTPDYLTVGATIARLRRPTLFVLEGGYAVSAIGENVANVLDGFAGG